MRIPIMIATAALASSPAAAEVKSADENGFSLAYSETVASPPDQVWATLRAPARWWNKDHTYSGDAANLWIDAQAGGCFCEKLADRGSVEHARIIHAQPGKILRMLGGLGPLQAHPLTGVLTFELKPAEGGGTMVSMTYVVAGRMATEGGTAGIAPVVDQVLGEQIAGLKAALDAPAP